MHTRLCRFAAGESRPLLACQHPCSSVASEIDARDFHSRARLPTGVAWPCSASACGQAPPGWHMADDSVAESLAAATLTDPAPANDEAPPSVEQVVTPWDVQGGAGGIDYDKLLSTFGCQAISPELIARCVGAALLSLDSLLTHRFATASNASLAPSRTCCFAAACSLRTGALSRRATPRLALTGAASAQRLGATA